MTVPELIIHVTVGTSAKTKVSEIFVPKKKKPLRTSFSKKCAKKKNYKNSRKYILGVDFSVLESHLINSESRFF